MWRTNSNGLLEDIKQYSNLGLSINHHQSTYKDIVLHR